MFNKLVNEAAGAVFQNRVDVQSPTLYASQNQLFVTCARKFTLVL